VRALVVAPKSAVLLVVVSSFLALLSCGGEGGDCAKETRELSSEDVATCAATAVPNWSVAESTPLPARTLVEVPYSNAKCPNHFVAEVDLRNRVLEDLYYVRVWPDGFFKTRDECEGAVYTVSVYRKIAGLQGEEWEQTAFDSYRFGGVWKQPVCKSKNIDGGLIDRGEVNTEIGDPSGWVDISDQPVLAVRLVIAGTSQCQQTPFTVSFRPYP